MNNYRFRSLFIGGRYRILSISKWEIEYMLLLNILDVGGIASIRNVKKHLALYVKRVSIIVRTRWFVRYAVLVNKEQVPESVHLS